MILGYHIFGEINETKTVSAYPYEISFENAAFDQIRADDLIDDSTVSFNKGDWTSDTLMIASFDSQTLDSGSVGTDGSDVTSIEVRRKRMDDLAWATLYAEPFTEDTVFTYTDKTASPVERYEYAIVPMNGMNELDYIPKSIYTEMDGAFIYDKNNRYEITYNFELKNLKHTMPNETIETMGHSRFPIVVYNGNLNYIESSINCLLFASGEFEKVDLYKEKKLREQVMAFITNRKPKAIKAYDGTNLMIAITGTPSLEPRSIGVYDLSFEFTEIGDMNDSVDLYNNNFIDLG